MAVLRATFLFLGVDFVLTQSTLAEAVLDFEKVVDLEAWLKSKK
jgi:hypothetical protein